MKMFRQNKILKGNVSIMIILILLACSLMGVLTVVFLKSLITYTDDTYSYHKSYYIAKAGLELALTEIDNSAMGFSQYIESGNVINNNFECVGCHFTSHIQGRSKFISNDFWHSDDCTETGALVLQPGQSLTIPMFYDKASNFNEVFSEIDYFKKLGDDIINLRLNEIGSCPDLNIGVIFQVGGLAGDISREYLYMTGMSVDENLFLSYYNAFNLQPGYSSVRYNLDSFNLFPYVIISNSSNDIARFCIRSTSSEQWPTTKYFISSLGEYMGKSVGLQAIYAQPTPSFFINPYDSHFSSY